MALRVVAEARVFSLAIDALQQFNQYMGTIDAVSSSAASAPQEDHHARNGSTCTAAPSANNLRSRHTMTALHCQH